MWAALSAAREASDAARAAGPLPIQQLPFALPATDRAPSHTGQSSPRPPAPCRGLSPSPPPTGLIRCLLPAPQAALLRNGFRLLRDGGTLVYSTCRSWLEHSAMPPQPEGSAPLQPAQRALKDEGRLSSAFTPPGAASRARKTRSSSPRSCARSRAPRCCPPPRWRTGRRAARESSSTRCASSRARRRPRRSSSRASASAPADRVPRRALSFRVPLADVSNIFSGSRTKIPSPRPSLRH